MVRWGLEDRGAVGSRGQVRVPFYMLGAGGYRARGWAEFRKGPASGRSRALDVRR
jgi:hypothetical protein